MMPEVFNDTAIELLVPHNNGDMLQHCHTNENKGIDKIARNKLIFASVLCVLFMAVEVVGGVFANSLAIATDAAHLLTDFASFMISLLALWLGSRPATHKMNFGWYRAEVVGALISVLLIWIVTAILLFMAIERLIDGEYEIDAMIMMISASIGILVNVIMGASLHFGGVSHGHSHGHSHTEVNEKSTTKTNINVRAAFIHVLGDLFQSIGVLIAAIIIYFKQQWNFVDPICTCIFSLIVLSLTVNIIRDTINIIMEGSPKDINFADVKQVLLDVPGVLIVHNLRVWCLSLDKTALAAHLAIGETEYHSDVLNMARKSITEKFNVHETIIQVEIYTDKMKNCTVCQKHL